MAEMKVEHTADGRELVYRVYVHPEVFNWFGVEVLIKALAAQFEDILTTNLYDLKEEVK